MKIDKIAMLLLAGLTTASFDSHGKDLSELNLEELMEVKVKVTTDSDKSLREAPGIVTVITEDQIRALGARDIKDVLLSVPGIAFGNDVVGNISIITRGIWAHEGRILLLIDGIEMNERSYGTFMLSNHYPADQIKRIEIIRGPGSAIYGGFAELGVINVITKSAEDLKGVELSTSNSTTARSYGQSVSNFMIGQKKDDLEFNVKGMYGRSTFSDRKYVDEYGARTFLDDGKSNINNEYLQFQSRYKDFYAQYIRDHYKTNQVIHWGDLENTTGSGEITPSMPYDYLMDVYQVGYKTRISSSFNLDTQYTNSTQFPYLQPDASKEVEFNDSWRRKVHRDVLKVKSVYKPIVDLSVDLGFEYSEDKSWTLNRLDWEGNPDTFGNGRNFYKIANRAAFSQVDYSTDYGNITLGARYDNPDIYKSTVVPRLGYTKIFGKNHLKTLYAEAFRAPVIENISLNKDIRPEITISKEIEFGHRFNQNLNWSINFFQISVRDPIVYSYNAATESEEYNNYGLLKTKGIETELNFKNSSHQLKLNYSFYDVDQLRADPYKSQKNNSVLIGSPQQKFFISDTIQFIKDGYLTPSLTTFHNTYDYSWSQNEFTEKRQGDQYLLNLFANFKNIISENFEVGIGINNLLNNNTYFSQPYVKPGDIKAGPYPGLSREYVVRLGYGREF